MWCKVHLCISPILRDASNKPLERTVQKLQSSSWPRIGELEILKCACPKKFGVHLFHNENETPGAPLSLAWSAQESGMKFRNPPIFIIQFRGEMESFLLYSILTLLRWILRIVIKTMDHWLHSSSCWMCDSGKERSSVYQLPLTWHIFSMMIYGKVTGQWPKSSRVLSQLVNKYILRLQAG